MKMWMVPSIACMRVHGICVCVSACMVQCALCARLHKLICVCTIVCLKGCFSHINVISKSYITDAVIHPLPALLLQCKDWQKLNENARGVPCSRVKTRTPAQTPAQTHTHTHTCTHTHARTHTQLSRAMCVSAHAYTAAHVDVCVCVRACSWKHRWSFKWGACAWHLAWHVCVTLPASSPGKNLPLLTRTFCEGMCGVAKTLG